MKKYLLIISFLFLLVGCGGGDFIEQFSQKVKYDPSAPVININSSSNSSVTNSNNQVYIKDIQTNNKKITVATIKKTGDCNLTLNIQEPKDIYLVVTNHDYQRVKINSSVSSDKIINSYDKRYKPIVSKTPQKVIDFRKKAFELLKKEDKKYRVVEKSYRITNENDSQRFCVDINTYDQTYPCTQYVDATARKVVKNINTKYGVKNLVIWVEDSEYNDGSFFSSGSITQQKVDELADIFLKNGEGNDIYDWDSNIFGKEWGSHNNSNLIASTNYIDILIYKMDNNGVAGYFWSKDNYKRSEIGGSNEKIMFYVNSTLYKNNEEEVFTTLVHEFQHMIHFYQRDVLKNLQDPVWFNEMMSEAAEDLIATKIHYDGPRCVDSSRGDAGDYPISKQNCRFVVFNQNNYLSLTTWQNNLENYAKVSSFGAYLLRNYEAKVLHDLIFSNKTGEDALKDATNKDVTTLVREWGEAVMLSSEDNLPNTQPKYNFGDFKYSDYDNITYELGSVNFFNYEPQPTFDNSKNLDKNSNLYYKVGSNLSGQVYLNIQIKNGADVTVIAK